jgi:nitrate/nitrite transporter NarK
MLFVTYGACFGVEVFIHNIAAIYYVDHFGLSLAQAGLAAGSFGLLALFARALGGWLSDKAAVKKGLDIRATLLFALIAGEGVGLYAFAHAPSVVLAIVAMLTFGLFTHMACGATYRRDRRGRQRRRGRGGLPDERPRQRAGNALDARRDRRDHRAVRARRALFPRTQGARSGTA